MIKQLEEIDPYLSKIDNKRVFPSKIKSRKEFDNMNDNKLQIIKRINELNEINGQIELTKNELTDYMTHPYVNTGSGNIIYHLNIMKYTINNSMADYEDVVEGILNALNKRLSKNEKELQSLMEKITIN